MRKFLLFSALFTAAISSLAGAQIVYEPVQYQFGQKDKFYYGGTNADLFRYALRSINRNHREVTDRVERVYSDVIGFQDARLFGYTATDARNEAYANAPTYFRKRDLLNAAIRLRDGSYIVPANAVPVADDVPRERLAAPTTRPATAPVFVIPREAVRPPKVDKVQLTPTRVARR